jgi:hypothetical protein
LLEKAKIRQKFQEQIQDLEPSYGSDSEDEKENQDENKKQKQKQTKV